MMELNKERARAMSYINLLREAAQKHKSIVCIGLDPDIEKIPVKGSIEEVIVRFFSDIIDAMVKENTLPGEAKPNYAFYSQYGFEGLKALKKVIDLYKAQGIPVILDAKRGDIGNTSSAYAREAFEAFG